MNRAVHPIIRKYITTEWLREFDENQLSGLAYQIGGIPCRSVYSMRHIAASLSGRGLPLPVNTEGLDLKDLERALEAYRSLNFVL